MYLLLAASAFTATLASGAHAQVSRCPAKADRRDMPWLNTKLTPECRAQLVLQSFKSIDEKVAAIASGGLAQEGGNWMTERGLPALRGSDGPAGVAAGGIAVTAFPAPLALAATFDRNTARKYGVAIGQDFTAFGFNRVTGPAMDIARTWHFGRTVESFGEDPYLTGEIAGHEISGIQSQHVMATAKHFTAYNQEVGRSGDLPLRATPSVNVVVSERALREIYLPAFESAVRIGKTSGIMCSFPRINGVYACENAYTLGILKNEWGFDGMVGPDFPTAQRSIIAAVNAGLDSGIMSSVPPPAPGSRPVGRFASMRTDNVFNGESLKQAVADGKISAARVDDLILRRLVPGFRTGAFDHPAKRTGPDVTTAARQAVAADIAAQSTVLLKNEGGILPFGQQVKSIAIIGHQAAAEPSVTMLGSGYVTPAHLKAVYPAVQERAGAGIVVRYAPGTLGQKPLDRVPVSMVRSDTNEAGFSAEYFANANLDFSGRPFLKRQEEDVWLTAIPEERGFPTNHAWSARWTGKFTPLESGVQHFTLMGSGTAKLYVNGKLRGNFYDVDFGDTLYANVDMKAGETADIRIEWTPRVTLQDESAEIFGTVLGTVIKLGWSGPNKLIDDAVAAAKQADVAVVFVGDRTGEGMDRTTLALPNDQNALIDAVVAANSKTVIVLQTGGAVTMPWLAKVPAVMEMWYPGDGFGTAAAKLLFGDAEPAGRLPVTFPRDEEQGPGQGQSAYPGKLNAAGGVSDVHYEEGVAVGYRFWDAHQQEPLFPFGYGLSYSKFTINGRSATRLPDGGVAVAIDVRNTGTRRGSEVVQVYVGMPSATGEPPRQLKGFERVVLESGEAKSLVVRLDSKALLHWDDKAKHWDLTPGTYSIMVGRSSRDIVSTLPLRASR
jgi:beta-glucosidase